MVRKKYRSRNKKAPGLSPGALDKKLLPNKTQIQKRFGQNPDSNRGP